MKKKAKKLTLSKETVLNLGREQLKEAKGLSGGYSCINSCLAECQISTDSDWVSCGFC